MARYAVRDDSNWPTARAYLTETRKIDPAIVDELHAVGSIYANDHLPNPSLVFLHRDAHGKVRGATLRDTRHQSAFRPCLGNQLSAWFTLGNLNNAARVVAVESPIDALSYYSLFASRWDALATVSCAGSTVPHELMFLAYDRRQPFAVGFDNDLAGERGWSKAWNDTTDWARFKLLSERPWPARTGATTWFTSPAHSRGLPTCCGHERPARLCSGEVFLGLRRPGATPRRTRRCSLGFTTASRSRPLSRGNSASCRARRKLPSTSRERRWRCEPRHSSGDHGSFR